MEHTVINLDEYSGTFESRLHFLTSLFFKNKAIQCALDYFVCKK